MAKVTTKKVETPCFVLELTPAEAVYVHAALYKTDPSDGSNDDVWDALDNALEDAGIESDDTAAEPIRS